MGPLIDTSIWVDHFRQGTPRAVKDQLLVVVNQKDICAAEPILFELLSRSSSTERARIEAYFGLIRILPTPPGLWHDAWRLGSRCADSGLVVPGMDLLIATVCIYHKIQLITFDTHFMAIAKITSLKATCLKRAK